MAIFLNENGQLTTLASACRTWIGTTAAHEAAIQAGTMPNNCTVAIIDEANQADFYYNNVSADLKSGIKQFASTDTAAQTWSDSYTIPSDGLYIISTYQTHQNCGIIDFESRILMNGRLLISNQTSNTWQGATNSIAVPLKAGVVITINVTRAATTSTGNRLGYVAWWIKQMQ